jgi:hypothetical protein
VYEVTVAGRSWKGGVHLHDHPVHRPPDRFGGTQTLHGGVERAYLLLSVIPGT